jgi:hypothetical protein
MAAMSNIKIVWIDRGREPQCPSDPAYPDGKHVDLSGGLKKACAADLPYPAARCGYYTVQCRTCGFSVIITTAGRLDDPRSVKLPCKGPQR